MLIDSIDQLTVSVLAVILGLMVGSFLNVVALRTLAGESIVWPPSACPKCHHRLAPQDNIPLFSYLVLQGKCRYCKEHISWQYPLVELSTSIAFLACVKVFGITYLALGMIFFLCTLITIVVTDIREKLIPHDITYPSMLVGLVFSQLVRNDFLGALAGVGASYIIFDFLAHYGLKLYLLVYAKRNSADNISEPADNVAGVAVSDEQEEYEDVEVMGGGDAVLSAVISAWLGWQKLALALIVGFLVGTAIGVFLMVKEMEREKILTQSLVPIAKGTMIGVCGMLALALMFTFSISAMVHSNALPNFPWLLFAFAGGVGGGTLGFVSVGTKVSKPFAFGPALAIGAVVAMFCKTDFLEHIGPQTF